MTTVYEKDIDGLIKTGQRSVTTFPSGLVRVDQLYTGKTGMESQHRNLLAYGFQMPGQEDAPAVDGVFIFPEVQETKNGNGFTNYQCSGYGRTTEQFREISRSQKVLNIKSITGQDLRIVVYDIIGTIVKQKESAVLIDDLTLNESLLNPSFVGYVQYPFVPLISVTEVNISSDNPAVRRYEAAFDTANAPFQLARFDLRDPTILITAQRNYGEFTEFEFLAQREIVESIE
jgi:hypothetical protein